MHYGKMRFLTSRFYILNLVLFVNRTKVRNVLIETRVSNSATFGDKGTEVPTLSRDKGTTGQAQNFTTGRDGPGF